MQEKKRTVLRSSIKEKKTRDEKIDVLQGRKSGGQDHGGTATEKVAIPSHVEVPRTKKEAHCRGMSSLHVPNGATDLPPSRKIRC